MGISWVRKVQAAMVRKRYSNSIARVLLARFGAAAQELQRDDAKGALIARDGGNAGLHRAGQGGPIFGPIPAKLKFDGDAGFIAGFGFRAPVHAGAGGNGQPRQGGPTGRFLGDGVQQAGQRRIAFEPTDQAGAQGNFHEVYP
jgi:hypothetical protein